MSEKDAVIRGVTAALEREPKIDVHHYPISLDFDSGILTLEGQVKDIAAKKLALELGAAVASVTGIVDRLKVAAAEHMTDKVMREHMRDVLLQESALNDCAVRLRQGDRVDVIREPPASRGAIEVTVENGDVLL